MKRNNTNSNGRFKVGSKRVKDEATNDDGLTLYTTGGFDEWIDEDDLEEFYDKPQQDALKSFYNDFKDVELSVLLEDSSNSNSKFSKALKTLDKILNDNKEVSKEFISMLVMSLDEDKDEAKSEAKDLLIKDLIVKNEELSSNIQERDEAVAEALTMIKSLTSNKDESTISQETREKYESLGTPEEIEIALDELDSRIEKEKIESLSVKYSIDKDKVESLYAKTESFDKLDDILVIMMDKEESVEFNKRLSEKTESNGDPLVGAKATVNNELVEKTESDNSNLRELKRTLRGL